jgi:hemerythrin superfamily protein
MKATDLLKKQHKEVKSLFKKIEDTDNPRQQRQMLDEVARDLEGYTLIEEEIFYPAVRALDTGKAEKMVLEAYEEHQVVKLVLAELPRVSPEDERFEAKMTVLSELVEHHADVLTEYGWSAHPSS